MRTPELPVKWTDILEYLKQQVTPLAFQDWLKPTFQVADDSGHCILVSVPTDRWIPHIEKQYSKLINDFLTSNGTPDVKIVYQSLQKNQPTTIELPRPAEELLPEILDRAAASALLTPVELNRLLLKAKNAGEKSYRQFLSHALSWLIRESQKPTKCSAPAILERDLNSIIQIEKDGSGKSGHSANSQKTIVQKEPTAAATGSKSPSAVIFLEHLQNPSLIFSKKRHVQFKTIVHQRKAERITITVERWGKRGLNVKSGSFLLYLLSAARRSALSPDGDAYRVGLTVEEFKDFLGIPKEKRLDDALNWKVFEDSLYATFKMAVVKKRSEDRWAKGVTIVRENWRVNGWVFFHVDRFIVDALRNHELGEARIVREQGIRNLAGLRELTAALTTYLSTHFHKEQYIHIPHRADLAALSLQLTGYPLKSEPSRKVFRHKLRKTIAEINQKDLLSQMQIQHLSRFVTVRFDRENAYFYRSKQLPSSERQLSFG